MSAQFSVIVPVYNEARYLGACLDSLLAQTLADWECIVVDDGSTDATPDTIAAYVARDSRIRAVTQANAGVSAARNRGAALARASWLCFLDSDDYFLPGALAAYAEGAAHASRPQIVCGGLESGLSEPTPLGDRLTVIDAFPKKYCVATAGPRVLLQCTALARSLLDDIGLFDENLMTGEDSELLIRATAAAPVVMVPRHVGHHRRTIGGGKSHRYIANGEKLATAQRIFRSLDPLIEGRLPLHSRAQLPRWRTGHLAMLDCGQHLRAGRISDAVASLRTMAAACAVPDETAALLAKLVYYLYYPYWIPAEATARVTRWFAAIDAELGASDALLRDQLAKIRLPVWREAAA